MTTASEHDVAQPSDPDDPHVAYVTGHREVLEAFRSPAFAVTIDADTVAFRGETVLRVDGARHTRRRRVLNELSRRDRHSWFRRTYLVPTVAAALDDHLAVRDLDGCARLDVPTFGKRVFLQLAAAITGFDAATSTDGAAELDELMEAIHDVLSVRFLQASGRQAVVDRATEAKERIRTRFFVDALARREQLVADHGAGRRNDDELPNDLLTLIARRADPAWDDPEIALREAVQMVSAATHTSAMTLTNAVHDLTTWFPEHPEDLPRRADKEFLLAALRETLRLRTIAPYFARTARSSVTLGSGRRIEQGERVHLCTAEAGRDPEVYGDDGHRFDPHRNLPRSTAQGLAFGSGSHMCFGLPFVLGGEGVDGNHVHVLERLYAAGMEPDPAHPAVWRGETTQRPYITRLGVRFPAA